MQVDVRSNKYNPLSTELKSRLIENLNFIFRVTPPFPNENLSIVFTDYFSNDVKKFQIENGISKLGHSEGAAGKVCQYTDTNGCVQTTIFLNLENFKNVLDFPYTECPLEIHYVQHEFGHVYDDFNTSSIFPESFVTYSFLTDKKRILYDIASIGWSEFQANFIASYSIAELMQITNSNSLLGENIDFYGNYLANSILDLEKKLVLAKAEIRESNGFCTTIQYYTKDILYYSGQLLGIIVAFRLFESDSELSEVYKYIIELFRKLGFADNLEKLLEIFNQLNLTYPDWEDFRVLNPLCEWIEIFWNEIGLQANDRLLFSINS
ncbi:hypothetical protein [Fictibacillus sp. FJAT-27399]|uniref:hypothetical protein n=1 Tax=Fictibacillus sp. FJAT-27399 TaxID=1729689 RepID=UPI000783BDE8|nr:hypothetical protein [Fictibacillus sp. FJAT-27399]